jgi:hypothetical protein
VAVHEWQLQPRRPHQKSGGSALLVEQLSRRWHASGGRRANPAKWHPRPRTRRRPARARPRSAGSLLPGGKRWPMQLGGGGRRLGPVRAEGTKAEGTATGRGSTWLCLHANKSSTRGRRSRRSSRAITRTAGRTSRDVPCPTKSAANSLRFARLSRSTSRFPLRLPARHLPRQCTHAARAVHALVGKQIFGDLYPSLADLAGERQALQKRDVVALFRQVRYAVASS